MRARSTTEVAPSHAPSSSAPADATPRIAGLRLVVAIAAAPTPSPAATRSGCNDPATKHASEAAGRGPVRRLKSAGKSVRAHRSPRHLVPLLRVGNEGLRAARQRTPNRLADQLRRLGERAVPRAVALPVVHPEAAERGLRHAVEQVPVSNDIATILRRMQPRCQRYRGGSRVEVMELRVALSTTISLAFLRRMQPRCQQ